MNKFLLLTALTLGCGGFAEGTPADNQTYDNFNVAVLPTDWGTGWYIPNDDIQTWRFASTRDWIKPERDALIKATEDLQETLPVTVVYDQGGLSTNVDAIVDIDPSPVQIGCQSSDDPKEQCVLAYTSCTLPGAYVGGLRSCNRWSIKFMMANIYWTYNHSVGLPLETLLRAVFTHELGHTLGFNHEDNGIMRLIINVFYGDNGWRAANFTDCDLAQLQVFADNATVQAGRSVSFVTPPECSEDAIPSPNEDDTDFTLTLENVSL